MFEENFWVVSRLDGKENSPRIRHKSYVNAQAEVERLARMYPGVEFFVLVPLMSRVAKQEVTVIEKVYAE